VVMRLLLHPIDPVKNARRKRAPLRDRTSVNTIAFDPPGALLDRAVRRRPGTKEIDR